MRKIMGGAILSIFNNIQECKQNKDNKIQWDKCIPTLKDKVITNIKNSLTCIKVDKK